VITGGKGLSAVAIAGSVGNATASGQPAAKAHRLDIQGLRAIAVLMVVAFHAGLPVPGGFVGVDVFFVISGFVITAMLMREWATQGRIRLGRFYVRRFKRLTPALAVTVAVVMLASVLLLSPFGSQQIAAQTGLGAMLLVANVMIARSTGGYFDAPAESNPLLNTWSLSVEEQFYLIFPAILMLGWLLGKRLRRPHTTAVAVVAGVGVVSFALALAGAAEIKIPLLPDSLVGFYGPGTRAWEFAVGALLALGGAKLNVVAPRVALPLAAVGGGMLAASVWLISGDTPFPGPWTLLPVIGTLLLIAAGTSNTGIWITRALGSAPMVAIGDRSYSIYLWHWPFIVFAQLLWPDAALAAPIAAVLSLLPAYASYRWVEQPIRTLQITGGVPLVKLVTATVLPPILLAGGLGLAARNAFWSPSIQAYQGVAQADHLGRLAGCHESMPNTTKRRPGDCTWNAAATHKPIYLVGDSNADHFSEAVILAAEALGRPVTTYTASSCPFVDIQLERRWASDPWSANCLTFTLRTLADLSSSSSPSGTVIISTSDAYWWSNSDYTVGGSADADVKLRALSVSLTSTIHALKGAGHSVLLVQSIPKWVDDDRLADCSLLSLLTNKYGCSQGMPLGRALGRQGAVRSVLSNVAEANEIQVLDTWSSLCSQTETACSSLDDDGLPRYRDGAHITARQSKQLADEFQTAIAAAG